MQVTVSLQPGSHPRLAAIASKLDRPSVQGLILAVLFVAIVVASFTAYSLLSNTSDYVGYGYAPDWWDTVYGIWVVVLFATAVLAGLVVLVALPIAWGRRFGWKRVFVIICYTLLSLFAGLVVSTFILYLTSRSAGNQQNNLCQGSNFDITGNNSCNLPL